MGFHMARSLVPVLNTGKPLNADGENLPDQTVHPYNRKKQSPRPMYISDLILYTNSGWMIANPPVTTEATSPLSHKITMPHHTNNRTTQTIAKKHDKNGHINIQDNNDNINNYINGFSTHHIDANTVCSDKLLLSPLLLHLLPNPQVERLHPILRACCCPGQQIQCLPASVVLPNACFPV